MTVSPLPDESLQMKDDVVDDVKNFTETFPVSVNHHSTQHDDVFSWFSPRLVSVLL